jgi:Tfp pilus assembly protein PilF
MLKEANELKELGNKLYARGEYSEALGYYTNATERCGIPKKEHAVFWSNLAACHLKLVSSLASLVLLQASLAFD